jgi:hypothetical protein
MRRIVVLIMLMLPALVRAQSAVTVQLSPEGDQLAQQLGVSAAELAAQIKTRVDDIYQTANVDDFLEAFTDATSFSARGIGADYASAPRGFIAGIAANVAAAGDENIRSEDRPTAGVAANLAVMIGMNLREWGQPRWTVYANGFYRNAETEQLDGTVTSGGAHVQYQLLPPSAEAGAETFMRWIGVSLTTGLEYTRWQLGSDGDTLSTSFAVGSGSNTAPIVLESVGRLDLTSTAVTVPLEATTGIRVALLATLYVGAGLDFTIGRSTIDSSLSGVMRASDGQNLGTVDITAAGTNNGSPGTARILAGVQLNLWKLKLFGQVNASQAPAASIAFGLKFVQ